MWVVGHTSPTYCCYLPGIYAGSKLYCLVTEAHVCEKLAQSRCLMVQRLGVKPGTFWSLVQHCNYYTSKPHMCAFLIRWLTAQETFKRTPCNISSTVAQIHHLTYSQVVHFRELFLLNSQNFQHCTNTNQRTHQCDTIPHHQSHHIYGTRSVTRDATKPKITGPRLIA